MEIANIIAELKAEIVRLTKAVALLEGTCTVTAAPVEKAPKKRKGLSAEGRAKIAAAAKARWARQKATEAAKAKPTAGKKASKKAAKKVAAPEQK